MVLLSPKFPLVLVNEAGKAEMVSSTALLWSLMSFLEGNVEALEFFRR